mmetsp:Transcript_21156/g.41966  ORF Transcript_21156/g.41966 Transcript_21156/m.41966 type:complete len:222 (+) Transcript_21156:557-1222(+)
MLTYCLASDIIPNVLLSKRTGKGTFRALATHLSQDAGATDKQGTRGRQCDPLLPFYVRPPHTERFPPFSFVHASFKDNVLEQRGHVVEFDSQLFGHSKSTAIPLHYAKCLIPHSRHKASVNPVWRAFVHSGEARNRPNTAVQQCDVERRRDRRALATHTARFAKAALPSLCMDLVLLQLLLYCLQLLRYIFQHRCLCFCTHQPSGDLPHPGSYVTHHSLFW